MALNRSPNYGKRNTVAQRRRKQAAHQIKGRGVGWSSDALDFYLSGVPMAEIAETYSCSANGLYAIIAKEALLRLLEAKHKDQMSEVEELAAVSK